VEFWTQWLTAALWLGDGFIYCPVRDSAGQPVRPLWQLHPSKVTVDGADYYVEGSDQPLPAGSVIHLRGEPPYFAGRGHGVLTRHAATLGLSLTVGNYAAGQYRSGVPSGVLKSTQPHMEPADAAKLKADWMSVHGGSQRSIAVLNATTDFTPLAVTPVDAALDIANMWNLRQLAISFGVPPYMLGVPGDSGTYANVESRMIELRQFTLLQWVRRAESTLDAQFPLGTSLKIKTAGLERADTKSRYESYKIGVDGGWLTVNDIRALEDMPPIEQDAQEIANLQPDNGQPPAQLPPMPQVPQLPAPAPSGG
jgi:HK97 family phage portal protein